MNYTDWLNDVHPDIQKDTLWRLDVYRKALYVSDIAWVDCEVLLKHPIGKPIASQLIRSAGSIAANMEEGFGRGYGKDYARFLRISLGSARETRGWYFRGRRILTKAVINERLALLKIVISGLVTLSKQQSQYKQPRN